MSSSSKVTGFFPLFLLIFSGFASKLAGELVISEFLARNSGAVLTDEDGFPADWIEIHNPDASPVNLIGYALTDDASNLQKWLFPSVTLPGGAYLRVFATGKDRKTNANFLHTNFNLNGSGEYLALVKPGGISLAAEFAPAYPPQLEDISYGLGNGGPVLDALVLPLGSPLTYLVPTGEIGDSWKLPTFDDSAWTTSASAVGFGYDPPVANFISATGNVGNAMFGVNASIYLRCPFQIQDPIGVESLTLRYKIDDGFVAYLNGVEVASENKPTTLAYNSAAGGSGEVDPGEEYQVATLDITGLLVPGENILAVQAMNSNVANNDFIFIAELDGRIQDLSTPSFEGYFEAPSPGTRNGAPKLAPPPAVQFDSTSRAFTQDFQLTLSVATPAATIRYTTNGDPVTEESTVYSGPIPIDRSTQIRTRAFLAGALPGPGSTHGFMKLGSEANFSSDLPVVLLSTLTPTNVAVPESSQTTRRDVFMLIYEPDPITGRTTLTGTPTLVTRGGYRKRGSSSASFPKYAMSFESWDENNNDKDIEPLGFAPDGDWILNSRYSFDFALIRNPLIYSLSNDIGRWAVKTRFVELYNDTGGTAFTSSDYFGVYTFMERIESGNGRLDISGLDPWENSPEEITGGYIFKKDRADPGEPTFSVAGFQGDLVHVEPDNDDLTAAQRNYIRTHTNEVLAALTNPNGINPSTGIHFSDYLDVDSFIDNFLLNILALDPDWGRLSQFFYKDRGGKIVAGPIWDYDRTMGSRDFRDDSPRVWEGPPDASRTWYDAQYQWFGRLFGFSSNLSSAQRPQLVTTRPDVFQQIIDRWSELRQGGLSGPNIEATIDLMADEIREAQARNFSRWTQLNPGVTSDSRFGPNFAMPGTSGWELEISHLKGWLEARYEWIDDQFLERPTLTQNGGVVDPGFELVMSSPEGQIYFTTDGSDPRAPGGTPASTAIPFDGGPVDEVLIPEIEAAARYLVPSSGSLGLTWTQTNFDDSSWATGSSGIGFETAGGALEPGVTTNIGGQMLSVNASCYLRFEFDFNNRENINSLMLGMKYDDGFIAYLNGVEVARDRAPSVATWNSGATSGRSDSEAIGAFVQFDITQNAAAVLNGRNVLAIHGMNTSAASSDFLCLPTISVNHNVAASPVSLSETTPIIARTYNGLEWSAPTRATFVIGGLIANASNLVISEIMYDPATPTAAEELAGFTSDSFFEYLEIYNPTNMTVDLSEVTFTAGIDFSFASAAITALPPGGRALIVRSTAGMVARYGNGITSVIAGEFANGTGLSGNGERLVMEGAEGIIADLTYDNNFPWPKASNGEGPSLVYLSNANHPGLASNWRPSVETLGNPGTGDATTFAGITTEDLDGDGFNAFAEYALGTSDSQTDTAILIGSIDLGGRYALTYPRNLAADDAEVLLQVSTDLNTWSLATEVLEDGRETHNGDGTVTYTFRTPVPATTQLRLFGRILILPR